MAKTIMVSNEIYKELKARKNDKSFSEIITSLIEKKERKTVKNLFDECFGLLEGDKEYDKIMNDLKKGWKKWTEEYA